MGGIPSSFLDELASRAEIVEVISGYIPLKRAGANFKACCPFHKEKTASFMVSPTKQIFHCFGCGAGGNVFSFVMKFERVEFPEAVKILADRYGAKVPEAGHQATSQKTDTLYKINELASSFYHAMLLRQEVSHTARRYLAGRKIADETIKHFRLGLALNAWDGLLNYAKSKGVSPQLLASCGLALKGKDGGYYDMFRNRLIFPIFNIHGRVLGFGGRALSSEQLPKYLNSPETPLYNKGRHLYGFNLAKEEVKATGYVVVVEGYFDMITPFQEKIRNVVATLGTALTTDHAKLLKRFTQNVTIVYDPDTAGEDASLRGLEVLLAEELNVKIAGLPTGYDPDDFLKQKGRDAFLLSLGESKGLFEYKLDLLERRFDTDIAEEKGRVAAEMLSTISMFKSAVVRSAYIKKLAGRLSVSEDSLISETKRLKHIERQGERQDAPIARNDLIRPAEKVVAALLLEGEPFATQIRNELPLSHFKNTALRKMVELVYLSMDEKKQISASGLITILDEPNSAELVASLIAETEKLSNKEKALRDCVNWLRRAEVEEKLAELQGKIKTAQGASYAEDVTSLISEFNELVRSLNN